MTYDYEEKVAFQVRLPKSLVEALDRRRLAMPGELTRTQILTLYIERGLAQPIQNPVNNTPQPRFTRGLNKG